MSSKESAVIATLGVSSALLFFGSTLAGTVTCQKQQAEDGSAWVLPVGYKSDAYPLMLLSAVANLGVAAWLVKGDRKAIASQALPTGQSEGFNPPVQVGRERVDVEADAIASTWIDDLNRQDDNSPESPKFDWLRRACGYKLVQIFGGQGSGKSTTAHRIVYNRVQAGHHVEIWDAHRDKEDWVGLPVYGGGMAYEAIDKRMEWAHNLIKSRYQDIELKGAAKSKFRPVTIVVEELTNLGKRCKAADAFYEAALSDIRKVNVFVIFISHDRTLSASGGSKGLARARDASVLEIELFTVSDSVTGKEYPSGKGRMKTPGSAESREIIDIETAPWMVVPKGFDYRSLMPGDKNNDEPSSTLTLNQILPNQTPQQQWERLLLESSDDQINGLIERFRNKPDVSGETDDSNTVSSGSIPPELPEGKAYAVSMDRDTFSEYFPNTTELDLFQAIEQGYQIRLSASDVVKKHLKQTSPERYPIGRAAFIYLVRKYGSVDMLVHFKKYLEDK